MTAKEIWDFSGCKKQDFVFITIGLVLDIHLLTCFFKATQNRGSPKIVQVQAIPSALFDFVLFAQTQICQ
jgi:hypothetical protein